MKFLKWIKSAASHIFSKLVMGILAIVIQFGWILYLLIWATTVSTVLNYLLHLFAVILALYLISKETKLSFKLSWVFFILVLPIAGSVCYFLFGRSDLTKHRRRRLAKAKRGMQPYWQKGEAALDSLYEENVGAWRQSKYIADRASYPLLFEQESTYYSSGEEVYPHLLKDLAAAEQYIFMEYFIIAPGEMWENILTILQQKVAQGVVVRLLYDDIGSINTLPHRYYMQLRQMGIQCEVFHPFRPFLSIIMNNRDHRKICVVDGRVAYTGGFNLADEYINKLPRFGYWKDEGIRLTGGAAWSFTLMFLEMWSYVTQTQGSPLPFMPREQKEEAPALVQQQPLPGKGYVQPFSDSPLDCENVSENIYLQIISRAEHYIYIFTPYLIASQEIGTALCNAAKSGVDVRIVTPQIPDKKLAFLLTQSNYRSLIAGGVKIYQFTPGFIHSKCILADGICGVVGTINLDYRSMYLHFECGVYLYRAAALKALSEDMEQTLAQSRQVDLSQQKRNSLLWQTLLSILRLFAPLF